MTALFLDSAVWAFALGDEHPRRDACRAVLLAAQRGEVELHASVELVQEVVFHRLRRTGRANAVAEGRAIERSCALHPFDAGVLGKALELTATTTLRGRDAVHAATALLNGFDAIVSPDRDFADVPDLRRLDPADALKG
ncbi:MAG TPA: type II toxin-antitoxin system VapC family toxin [Cellulomonas sp.]